MKIWIPILIICEGVIIYCHGFDDYDEPKLSKETLDVSESAWIEEGDKNNLKSLKIIKPSIRIGVKHPDDPDISWEYEIIQAKPYVNVQPSISDMSDEENDEDAIDDEDDDDDRTRQKRQLRDYDYGDDYNNFVKRNFETYSPDMYQPQLADRKMTSEEEDDYDDAKVDRESDADYERVKKLSEKQADNDKKNKEFCRVIHKNNKECVVCKNPKTGGESESCSYSKDSKPKEFTYKRNINKDDKDDKDDDADQDDDGEGGDRDGGEGDGGETEDDVEYDDGSEKGKNKLHPTEFQPQQPQPAYRSQPKLFTPAHYQEYHNYHPPQYSYNYKNAGQNPYGPSSFGYNTYNDRRYYPTYTTKNIHPDTNTKIIVDELPVYDEVEEEDNDDDDQAPHSSAPAETTETTLDRDNRVKEFKSRDWSNCEQKFKKNLTCYYCLDEEGDRIEECMLLDDKNHVNENGEAVKEFLQNGSDNRKLKSKKNKGKSKKKNKRQQQQQKSESKKTFVTIKVPTTSTTLEYSHNNTNGNNRTVEQFKPTEIAKHIIKKTVKNLYYQKMNIF